MRWLIVVLTTIAAVAVACGSDGGGEGGGDDAEQIRAVISGFTEAINDRNYDKAYDFLAQECREDVSQTEFATAMAFAGIFLGEIEMGVGDVTILELTEDEATVAVEVTFSGDLEGLTPEQDQEPSQMVKEDGTWKTTDCGDFSGIDATDPSSGDEPPPTGPGANRAEAVPPGDAVLTPDGLEVTVTDVDDDAWPLIESESMFNEQPAEGNRMVMISVSVTNRATAEESQQVSSGDFLLTGSNNSVYEPYSQETSCGQIPDEIQAELFPGGATTGNVCFQIPEEETDLILIAEFAFSFDQNDRRYLALE